MRILIGFPGPLAIGRRRGWGDVFVGRKAVGAVIVAASAGTVATMIASVILGPLGDQVLARNGDAARNPYETMGIGAGETPVAAAPSHAFSHMIFTRRAESKRVEPTHVEPTHQYARVEHHRRPNGAPATWVASASAGHHSMCVRLCDGYFFPLGDVHGAADLDTQAAVCSSACPGAPTRLFTVPSGTSEIDKAVSITDGKPYTALPVAFAHTKEVGPTCTCHAAGAGEVALVSASQDITLRNGDSVMTAAGWRIFKGTGHWPYTQADYTSLAGATQMPEPQRTALLAMEAASIGPAKTRPADVPPAPDLTVRPAQLGLKGADGHVLAHEGALAGTMR